VEEFVAGLGRDRVGLEDLVSGVNLRLGSFYRGRDLVLLFSRMGGESGSGVAAGSIVEVLSREGGVL
jgi:hypothetical protein